MYFFVLKLLCIPTSIIILFRIVDYVLYQFRVPNLYSRYVFITGCDSGFGHLAAKKLDALGVNVFAGCYSEKGGGTELTKACSSRLKALHIDIANTESVKKAFEVISSHLPTKKGLWGIVNNAGIPSRGTPTDWLEVDDYQTNFNVNFYGMVRVNKVFLPLVKKAKGRIVNISSMAGRVALENAAVYCVSKHAVETYSDILRREMYPFGVTVHIIAPMVYKTGIYNPDNLKAVLKSKWESLSPQLRQEYGKCFLDDMIDYLLHVNHMASEKIHEVTDAYEHALFSRYPRTRYVMGNNAWLLLLISRLPDTISDAILRAIFPRKRIASVSR